MATLARLSDSNVRGSDAGAVRPVDVNTTWSPSSLQASTAARRKEDAAVGRPLVLPHGGFPKPAPRYGYPDGAKGAIYALDPNDSSKGDVLYFSRYPKDLTETIEAALASDTAPGRAFPAFQQMGAKGVKLSTELWFCDAFMWSRGSQFVTVYAPEYNGVRNDPTDFQMLTVPKGATGTLAEQARTFFEFYLAGHDGTGLALPPADVYLHWGGRDLPVPIIIERVEMKLEDFTSPPIGARANYKPGGVPQTVTVRIDMQVNVPLRVTNPFQPAKPQKPKSKPPNRPMCPNPGQLVDGTQVLLSATQISNPGWAANIGADPTRVNRWMPSGAGQ